MVDLTSSESPSPKRPHANQPRVELTTDGLDAAAVRQILLFAVDKHPKVSSLLEKHRLTVLDGLSAEASRTALLEIAQKHEDVLQEIGPAREKDNVQVQTFGDNVSQIRSILGSLDDISKYAVRSRLDEFLDPAREEIQGIADQLTRFSNAASIHNALAALSQVTQISCSFYVEQAMEESGGFLGTVEMTAVSVLDLMRGKEKAEAIEGLGPLRGALRDSNVGDLERHIHDWETNPTENESDSEEEDSVDGE